MSVHFVYLSLLALAAGFIGFLKFELDSNLEKFENGKIAIAKISANLKENLKITENDLSICKRSLSSSESLNKEVEDARTKLADATKRNSVCTEGKAAVENEFNSLKESLNKLSTEKANFAQQFQNCEIQKGQAVARADQEALNSKQCQEAKNQCDQDKAYFNGEHLKWKQNAEQTNLACQADKENLLKVDGNLKQCQQTIALLQNEKNQLAQTVQKCLTEKQQCDKEKLSCLQALQAARGAQQQQQVPPQQQQQVPPQQQQQVPPQQQQQVPPQQQQQQQVPPQQQPVVQQQQQAPQQPAAPPQQQP